MVPGIANLASSFKDFVVGEGHSNGHARATSKPATPHPLDPLSEDEIRRTGLAIRKHFTEVRSQQKPRASAC